MEHHSLQTLEQIRAAVARVNEADLSRFKPEDPLELDSIARIALIAELENEFELEIASDHVQPEAFESLATLTALIEAQRA